MTDGSSHSITFGVADGATTVLKDGDTPDDRHSGGIPGRGSLKYPDTDPGTNHGASGLLAMSAGTLAQQMQGDDPAKDVIKANIAIMVNVGNYDGIHSGEITSVEISEYFYKPVNGVLTAHKNNKPDWDLHISEPKD